MMINHQVLKYFFWPTDPLRYKIYKQVPRFWGFHTRYVLHFFWVHCMTAFKGVGTNGTPNLMTHEMPGISGRWMVVAQAALIFIHFWLKNFRSHLGSCLEPWPALSSACCWWSVPHRERLHRKQVPWLRGWGVSNASCAGRTKRQFLHVCRLACTAFARAVVVSNVSCVGKMPRPSSPAVLNRWPPWPQTWRCARQRHLRIHVRVCPGLSSVNALGSKTWRRALRPTARAAVASSASHAALTRRKSTVVRIIVIGTPWSHRKCVSMPRRRWTPRTPAVGFMAPRGCSAPGKRMRRPAWRTAARAAVASVSCADKMCSASPVAAMITIIPWSPPRSVKTRRRKPWPAALTASAVAVAGSSVNFAVKTPGVSAALGPWGLHPVNPPRLFFHKWRTVYSCVQLPLRLATCRCA